MKLKTSSCSCPHVLIADDDRFQHFCYHNLFQKSLEYNDPVDEKEGLHIKLFFYGEELIRRVFDLVACGCNKLMLVIIDYSMGSSNLNGIETAFRLRKAKYTGCIILRTSENEEYLKAKHNNYHSFFETNIISEMMSKNNMNPIKDIIRQYVQKG